MTTEIDNVQPKFRDIQEVMSRAGCLADFHPEAITLSFIMTYNDAWLALHGEAPPEKKELFAKAVRTVESQLAIIAETTPCSVESLDFMHPKFNQNGPLEYLPLSDDLLTSLVSSSEAEPHEFFACVLDSILTSTNIMDAVNRVIKCFPALQGNPGSVDLLSVLTTLPLREREDMQTTISVFSALARSGDAEVN